MAIHCLDLNKMGEATLEMFNVTDVEGRTLLNDFSSVINKLNVDWKGEDATKNLTELKSVYVEVAELVDVLQKIVVEVHNNEVLPLQKHVAALGGSSVTTAGELGLTVSIPEVTVTPSTEIYVADAVVTDALEFDALPAKFDRFVVGVTSAKDKLLSNWVEGPGLQQVKDVFGAFEQNVGTYTQQLGIVKENLNVIAESKRKLLGMQ